MSPLFPAAGIMYYEYKWLWAALKREKKKAMLEIFERYQAASPLHDTAERVGRNIHLMNFAIPHPECDRIRRGLENRPLSKATARHNCCLLPVACLVCNQLSSGFHLIDRAVPFEL
jgi:hypothetical protein